MAPVSKAVEGKIKEYLKNPSKFKSTEFHDYLTKEEKLTKRQVDSIVKGIECCNKKGSEVKNEDFRTICQTFSDLSECASEFENFKKEWQEAGRKYFNVWRDRMKNIPSGVVINTKKLYDSKLLPANDEMELNLLASSSSALVDMLKEAFLCLGIKRNEYDAIFSFYEDVAGGKYL